MLLKELLTLERTETEINSGLWREGVCVNVEKHEGENQELYLLHTRGEVNAGPPAPDMPDPSTLLKTPFCLVWPDLVKDGPCQGCIHGCCISAITSAIHTMEEAIGLSIDTEWRAAMADYQSHVGLVLKQSRITSRRFSLEVSVPKETSWAASGIGWHARGLGWKDSAAGDPSSRLNGGCSSSVCWGRFHQCA